jgi:hypothetical protein
LTRWNDVAGKKAEVCGVLYFDASETVMESRILQRGKTSAREDDNIESIKKRFRTYIDSTRPIIGEFEGTGKVWRINADQSVDDVFVEVYSKIPLIIPGVLPTKPLSKSTNVPRFGSAIFTQLSSKTTRRFANWQLLRRFCRAL